jgi:hypothetical protein
LDFFGEADFTGRGRKKGEYSILAIKAFSETPELRKRVQTNWFKMGQVSASLMKKSLSDKYFNR